MNRWFLRKSALTVLLCGASLPALAQTALPDEAAADPAVQAETGGLGEIIVTAQRRSENLQRAALSVTAVTGDTLVERGVTGPENLTLLAPALQVTATAGPYVAYTMRGVTSVTTNAYGDPALALNYNQVYLATPTAASGLYFDLDRVEVLKGPQGTLYGRNATGGAINVIPRRPELDARTADVGFDVGNYAMIGARAAINLPLGDSVALRIAGQTISRDGYFSDGTGDENGRAIRTSLLLEPATNFSLLVMADYSSSNDRGGGATIRKACGVRQACFVADPFTGLQDLPQAYAPLAPASRNTFNRSHFYGISAVAELATDFATLTVIPGYRKSRVRVATTQPGFYYRSFDDPEQFSLEARLASDNDRPLRWLVGGYYLTTQIDSINNSESAAGRSVSASFYELGGHSLAAFGQLTLALTPEFRLTGGARYTYEKKSANVVRYTLANTVGPNFNLPDTPPAGLAPTIAFDSSATFDAVTWRGGVEWDVGARSLLYANVGTGFKAGGFFSGPPGANTYRPEKVTAYAIGSKNRFLDNRLQVNVEAFLQDYTDQQINYIKIVSGAAIQVTENVGRARMKGVDLETVFLVTPTTQVTFQGQYIDAKYKSLTYTTVSPPPATTKCVRSPATVGLTINCDGQSSLRSPEWVLSGSIEQTIELGEGHELVLGGNARYESSKELDIAYIPETAVAGAERFDLSIAYRDTGRKLGLTAFVNNLTDKAQPASAVVTPGYAVDGVVALTMQPPRTYGLRLNASF